MKLLTSASALRAEFKRLTRHYSALYWSTAWAGPSSEPYTALVLAKKKIRRLVVGLHFYQTHPDFIEAFLGHKGVRFMMQPAGTFHPKVYLFFDSDTHWEMLVGSANFTAGAFTANTEAVVLITDGDEGAAAALASARAALDTAWKDAKVFTQVNLDAYRTTWKNMRPLRERLSGQYGSKRRGIRPIHQVPVTSMTWETFMNRVRRDPHHSLQGRLGVIANARRWSGTHIHFSDMNVDQRRFIAGLPNGLDTDKVDGRWFGSMVGGGNISESNKCERPGDFTRSR